jgi:hypothetical protein
VKKLLDPASEIFILESKNTIYPEEDGYEK